MALRKKFALEWVFEPLVDEPSYFIKRMFGGLAIYLHGKMVLVIMESPGDREWKNKKFKYDIWNGVLLPTSHEFHQALSAEFPALRPHGVLGKWMYIPESDPSFESTIEDAIAKILRDDRRFGVYPKIKKSSGPRTASKKVTKKARKTAARNSKK
jgi:hypothetical protein